MNYTDILNKSIALLIWGSEKEYDAHVYLGRIVQDGERFQFVNETKGWRTSLNEWQMARVKPVRAETKGILLQADYFLSMSMGTLSRENAEDSRQMGVSWHAG